MKPLSIGEVAKRTGIRTSALRYYEEAGILPAAARVSGHRRATMPTSSIASICCVSRSKPALRSMRSRRSFTDSVRKRR